MYRTHTHGNTVLCYEHTVRSHCWCCCWGEDQRREHQAGGALAPMVAECIRFVICGLKELRGYPSVLVDGRWQRGGGTHQIADGTTATWSVGTASAHLTWRSTPQWREQITGASRQA